MAGQPVIGRALRALIGVAVAIAGVGAAPATAAAQEAARHCPPIQNRVSPAVRDSLLESLEPNEIALTGFVRDEAGQGVAGLVVVIEGTSYGTQTADDGGYLIRMRGRERIPHRPMVRACDTGWSYLTEVRELVLTAPWDGTVVVIDGVQHPNPGHAVRLDFTIRRRPGRF